MTIKDMLGRSGVVSREDALGIMDKTFSVPDIPVEEIPISAALDRILATDIVSPLDLPGFDRSTMDGYAVRSRDTFGASESRPALLRILGEVVMGVLPDRGIDPGEAMKIATGGALPPGADAVVMFEQTQPVDETSFEAVKAVAPLENVIKAGDDIGRGERILDRGRRIRPQDMAALASLGIIGISVFNKPKVGIISTGNEIVPAETVPDPGRIRDSNSYHLIGMISQAGGIPVRFGIVPDDFAKLRRALETAIDECGIVVMSGGSSVGTADLTAKVINDAGLPGVLVHGVSIRPGKPLISGLVKNKGGAHVPIFGLPGHPAAVSICFDLFVKPIIVRLTGEAAPPGLEGISPCRTVRARLARSIASGAGREDHVRVTLERKGEELWARPVFGASGLIRTLVKAVGTVVVPAGKIGMESGAEVEVRLF